MIHRIKFRKCIKRLKEASQEDKRRSKDEDTWSSTQQRSLRGGATQGSVRELWRVASVARLANWAGARRRSAQQARFVRELR